MGVPTDVREAVEFARDRLRMNGSKPGLRGTVYHSLRFLGFSHGQASEAISGMSYILPLGTTLADAAEHEVLRRLPGNRDFLHRMQIQRRQA